MDNDEKKPKDEGSAAKRIGMKVLYCFLGMLIGGANGFFGGGGGMLCVPILQRIMKKPVKKAHATAILVILPITLASAITYIVSGYYEIPSGLFVGGGVLAGGVLGAFLLSKLSNNFLVLLFALLMIGAGVKMVL